MRAAAWLATIPALGLGGLLIPALALASPRGSSGLAIEGFDQARVVLPAGARVSAYENAGYRLVRRGDEAYIEVDASPLLSTARFESPPASRDDPLERLARGLTVGATTEYDAVSRILDWVGRNVEYDLDRMQSQSAAAVLDRRSGYCTGVARLTVALLDAIGLPAREVAGYIAAAEAVGGYHRWVEVKLADRGWVFSDPFHSHHFVPATYVRLASDELIPTWGIDGLLLERHDAIAPADVHPQARPGIRARRNSRRRQAAALAVRLGDGREGRVVLTGRGERLWQDTEAGTTTFVGLQPGRYEVRIVSDGRAAILGSVQLDDRGHRTLTLPAAILDRHQEPFSETSRSRSPNTSSRQGEDL